MSTPFSVVTTVSQSVSQDTHIISDFIQRLEQAEHIPAEVVIVWTAPPSNQSLLQSQCFDVQHRFLTGTDLPQAKAKNKAFACASHDVVVYSQADCIWPADFFSNVLQHWQPKTVFTCEVEPVSAQHTAALSHPVDLTQSHQSALFAISKTLFEVLGGFDEQFAGFGICDIDFITRCRGAGLQIQQLPLTAYVPDNPADHPVHHLVDIVTNANLFCKKWGYYPATQWLASFVQHGFINADFERCGLSILRLPSAEEMEQLHQSPPVAAPSALPRMSA